MKKLLILSALLLPLTVFCAEKPTLVLLKKNHPKRERTLELPAHAIIKTIDKKVYCIVITGQTDSSLIVKARDVKSQVYNKTQIDQLREINKDKSISKQEKDSKVENVMYPLSLTIPFNSIKKMKYYVSDIKNGKAKSRIAWGAFLAADFLTEGVLISQSDNYAQPNNEPLVKGGKFTTDDDLLLVAATTMEYCLYYENRHIHPAKWQIIAKK